MLFHSQRSRAASRYSVSKGPMTNTKFIRLIQISVVTQTNPAICHITKCTVQYMGLGAKSFPTSVLSLVVVSLVLPSIQHFRFLVDQRGDGSRRFGKYRVNTMGICVRGRTAVAQNCPRVQCIVINSSALVLVANGTAVSYISLKDCLNLKGGRSSLQLLELSIVRQSSTISRSSSGQHVTQEARW